MLAAGAVHAASASASFAVSASVASGCTVTAPPLAFGTYTAGSGDVNASSTIHVTCSNTSLFAVGLSTGATAGASYAQRLLAAGTNTLQYNLYTTATYGAVWGDGSGATQVRSGVGAGAGNALAFTVYGKIPDNTTNRATSAGNYSDVILVVVVY
jgi:spore coat protein U-like protein